MGARVLITDDHPVVRQGLRMDLGLDPEVERVFEVEPFGTPHRLSQLELHPPTPCPDHGERVTRTGSCFLTSPNPPGLGSPGGITMSCLRKSPCPHHGASGRDSTRNIACNTEGVSSLYLTLRERLLNGTIWSEYLTFL